MTNLEMIRTMKKGELAAYLCDFFGAVGCSEVCPGYDYCRLHHKGLLDWLDMEADDGEE
jgi:hypothetical protein